MSSADDLRGKRAAWQFDGRARPSFAVTPKPGQESVWDYPRPPRLEQDDREVVVRLGDQEVARSRRSLRVLETASPPTFYVPPDDVRPGCLEREPGVSYCEWKGEARYWSVVVSGQKATAAAWSYPEPLPGFERLRDYVSFYPALVECFVNGDRVTPQPGGFYGGWVTPEVVGPFKGAPGSAHW